MSAKPNRKRIFADVVTVDAWHKEFDGEEKKVDLHADVFFSIARVGGEGESSVSFTLAIKRAELIVVIPDGEPVAIDKDSVAREYHTRRYKISDKRRVHYGGDVKADAKVDLDIARPSAGAGLSVAANAGAQAETSRETEQEILSIIVDQSKTHEGFYKWIMSSVEGGALSGKPWDAKGQPRLKIVDLRRSNKSLPPVVRIEVRCLKEDLVINDIKLKNETIWERIADDIGLRNKMIAAEAYIRSRLIEEGLFTGDFSHKFSPIKLANVSASAEK